MPPSPSLERQQQVTPRKSTVSENDSSAVVKAPMAQWIRLRLGFVYSLFVLYFGFVAFRLVQLQVLVNPELESLAQRQFEKVGKTSPHRLAIYDRNREELAASIPASSIFARPRLIPHKGRVARGLAQVLGGSPQKWLKKLDTPKLFVWIQRQVGEDIAKELSKKNLPGIFVETESKRTYPGGSLASQLIGFTDIDGNGISGLELKLNEELLKKGTRFVWARDGKGNPSYLSKKYFREDDGETGVYVTLDRRLQHALEEELDRALQETGAKAVLATVMDPFTGEIFALGQRPGFDPNEVGNYPLSAFTNHFISHLYEPGSTIKVLMAAEAISQGLMTAKTPIDCGNGSMSFGKIKISEAESSHRYATLPLEKVIQFSSNVGAVKVAQALGTDRVRATLDKFGLTRKTGIHLPGEVTSQARGDNFWRPIFLATVGFGQGISVTPLQMTAAFAPFANGGYLVRPRILLRENVSEERLEVRRVLTPSTVQTMRQILISTTEGKGTGTLAAIPEIKVAGKTGTAQKYEPGVGYQSNKYFSSFIGFLPADRPELLVSVFVDEPKKPYYASQVAAPLFKRIAERALQILDRFPKKAIVHSDTVKRDSVFPPESSQSVALLPHSEGKWVMPDLAGVSMREALRAVGKHLSHVKVLGDGYVTSQSPEKGSVVSSETQVSLVFSPAG